jgi:hypothetical protein
MALEIVPALAQFRKDGLEDGLDAVHLVGR